MIKEVSKYQVEEPNGNVLKKGFKDQMDAFEFAVNTLTQGNAGKRVVIRGTIEVTLK